MLNTTPLASAVKTVSAPPPQALPAIAEETKAVPGSETPGAVAPAPSGKGGNEPGLGERLDVYDNEGKPGASAKSPARKAEEARERRKKAELLGHGTGLPQPTVDPPPPELPFLRPLGPKLLGSSLDEKI